MNIHTKLLACAPWVAIIAASSVYIWISWIQYINFRNGIDLGTYTQILYNLSLFHHFPPFNSILGEIAWGDHAHFIMVLLAPLFAFYPHDITVIVLQIVAITTSAWAMYAIAHKRFKNYFYSYAVLVSYLLFFGVQYALSFDVHANVFTAAFLAWMLWAYETDKKKLYWIFFIVTLITREDAALFCGAFGTYIIFAGTKPQKITGAITLTASVAYFFFITYYLMPLWQAEHTALAYFDADVGILRHPIKAMQNMFDNSLKIRTIRNTFESFGFLPLASPFTYLAATPNILARFLSGEQQRWDMKLHYSVSLVSLLSYGSILGTAMILRATHALSRRIQAKYILALAGIALLYSTYTTSLRDVDLPLHQLATGINTSIDPQAAPMRLRLEEARRAIPNEDSISTISSFVPLFATREHITNFEGSENVSADWVIISNQFTAWPLSRSDINTAIHDMRENSAYEQVESSDGLFIFKKITPA